MKRIVIVIVIIIVIVPTLRAQNDARAAYEAFRKAALKEYADWRSKANREYADFMRRAWEEYQKAPVIPRPKEEDVPPVIVPKDEPAPSPKEDPAPLPYDEVITPPQPTPQPQPVEPIDEVPEPQPAPSNVREFTFFGTKASVRMPKPVHLSVLSEDAIADAWLELSGREYTNLVCDCLELRTTRSLCDWAYLMMLKEMATSIYGAWNNDATLLTAYVFCQSGYKMRLAHDGKTLYMMFASQHMIYEQSAFRMDDMFFYVLGECPSSLYICSVGYPREQPLSLWINCEQQFAEAVTEHRQRQSDRYPAVNVSYASNKNLMDFYDTYPTSMIDDNVCTRWAMYANTPMSAAMQEVLYPQLRAVIAGKTELEAANMLLNWVQTGFTYEYDTKVWGHDRAFFAEESLFYPYCDCEDRSILFTRIVRDLLGLPCILVYYPGHLAAAVQFSTPVQGDFIELQTRRFTITDPTYIGAPVGCTMTGMDNAAAKVILLER